MTHEQKLLIETLRELETMHERLEELEDWCIDIGDYRAIEHKLQETRGKLRDVCAAVAQHAAGVLPQRPAMRAEDMTCPMCDAPPGMPCDLSEFGQKSRNMHTARADKAQGATRKRDQEGIEEAEKLLRI